MSSNRVTATQKVATDLKVDASAVAVPVTDNGGSLTVDGTVTATGPLTDAQLRATAVPVSGTVTASGPLTDTQLRATAVPVSLAAAPTTAITAAALPLPAGAATAALQAGGLPAALGAGGGLKVDGSGTALPVSSTTLATVAKQPALGTAGTASTDVITVQGIASAYPLAVGLNQLNISQTPTVTNGAYAAEDAVGGLLTFANAARVSGLSGIISGITILCKSPLVAATVPSLELAFFNQTFTAMSDNGTWSPSDADMANFIGSIPVSSWLIATTNVAATRFGINFPFTLTGTSLFAQLITHTAVTLTSTSDLIIGIQVWRD